MGREFVVDNMDDMCALMCDNNTEGLEANTMSNEECDDCVSRQEVCNIANDIKDYCVSMYNPNDASEAEIINYIYKYVDALYDLPPVLPNHGDFREMLQDVGATNKEVLEVIFPNIKITVNETGELAHIDGNSLIKDNLMFVQVSTEWLNAPYKAVRK